MVRGVLFGLLKRKPQESVAKPARGVGQASVLQRLYGLLMRSGFTLVNDPPSTCMVRVPGGTLKRREAPPEGIAGRAGFRPYPGEFRAVRPDALAALASFFPAT